MRAASAILQTVALPTSGPFQTLDPFLFCVYHKDHYPAALDDSMEAPRRGNGHDFNPDAVSFFSFDTVRCIAKY